MLSILLKKMKESFVSVFPVAAIVFLLNMTPLVNFTAREMAVFLVSALGLIFGIGLFNLGADLAMTPMGEHIGSGLTKSKKLWLLLLVCFAMGVLITVAEPDLAVLASQVKDAVNSTALILTVGVGVGLFLVVAVLKIVFHKPLSMLMFFFYMALYGIIAILAVRGGEYFIPLAFDSGGVTTGPITVPFIMALGVGIAATLGGRNVSENSFGLVALCSIGPMMAVAFLGTTAKGGLTYTLPDYSIPSDIGSTLWHTLLETAQEVAIALGLVALFFFVLQFIYLHLPRKRLLQIVIGIAYTFFGLLIFLTAVKIGFMPIGYKMGTELAANHPALLVVFGFLLGLVVVLAEPAVHVLNCQVEEITDRAVSRTSMQIALSLGVGISIGLSMLRIVLDFDILYYLIPGYCISLGLAFFVPGLYTAIAFDSGGVASGPLTSSFILPFAIGACFVMQGQNKIMYDAFGVVAMVAMTPLITIQLLGFRAVIARKVREKLAVRRILSADDEQIIDFM